MGIHRVGHTLMAWRLVRSGWQFWHEPPQPLHVPDEPRTDAAEGAVIALVAVAAFAAGVAVLFG